MICHNHNGVPATHLVSLRDRVKEAEAVSLDGVDPPAALAVLICDDCAEQLLRYTDTIPPKDAEAAKALITKIGN